VAGAAVILGTTPEGGEGGYRYRESPKRLGGNIRSFASFGVDHRLWQSRFYRTAVPEELSPDFRYILGVQEPTVVAMADGFAQATGRPALVNLHTSAGTGNGVGNIMTAFLNKTPLVITAGQQTREMILCDPMLTNREETILPRPYVKWAYQPTRAQDVPGAIMRAYAMALQPPAGPVYVSITPDDWDQPALGPAVICTVSVRCAPDGDRLREFAKRISAAKKLALVYGKRSGAAVDGTPAWLWRRSLMRRYSTPRTRNARPFLRRIRCFRGCSRSPSNH
jgi:hypothetical protein